jgi:hypothetical protein
VPSAERAAARTVRDMRRISIVAPLVVVCALAAGAGCGNKSNNAGVGGLADAPSTGVSAAPSPSVTDGGSTTPPGGTPTTTPAKTKTPVPSWPTPEDCVSYNPTSVTLTGDATSGTFTISDGSTVVMRLHGQSDVVGQQGLALAQRYRKHCYIGRQNTRDLPGDYIFDYWRNPSGQTPSIPNQSDVCSPYHNHNLTVEDMGGGEGWRVKDHDHVLHVFDNESDARNGNLVLVKYGQICSIGNVDDTDKDLGSVTFMR